MDFSLYARPTSRWSAISREYERIDRAFIAAAVDVFGAAARPVWRDPRQPYQPSPQGDGAGI